MFSDDELEAIVSLIEHYGLLWVTYRSEELLMQSILAKIEEHQDGQN